MVAPANDYYYLFLKCVCGGGGGGGGVEGGGWLVLSCDKLASDRHAPLEVPAKGATTKHPPQTQLL